MSAPRFVLLARPHMSGLAALPVVRALRQERLEALERFMGFLATANLPEVATGDLTAYARLHAVGAVELSALESAIWEVNPEEPIRPHLLRAQARVAHRQYFRGITRKSSRDYYRTCAVPPWELPADWQQALCDMRDGIERGIAAPSPSIIDRIERRSGMFAFSAACAERPCDLADLAARRALYADMEKRTATKNGGTPRYAYLRSTFEELARLARYVSLPEDVVDSLDLTTWRLAADERQQEPLKWLKLAKAPRLAEIRDQAKKDLDVVANIKAPQHRHAKRNAMAAVMLGSFHPSRPEDFHRLRFGVSVLWEPIAGRYRVTYIPKKTRKSKYPTRVDVPLPASVTPFIDAMILGDEPPRHLGKLREKVLRDERAFIVHYDGTPAVYAWYSRIWVDKIGTGGHGARSMVVTDLADGTNFGLEAGRALIGHKNTKHLRKYTSAAAEAAAITRALDGLEHDEDLDDLLKQIRGQ